MQWRATAEAAKSVYVDRKTAATRKCANVRPVPPIRPDRRKMVRWKEGRTGRREGTDGRKTGITSSEGGRQDKCGEAGGRDPHQILSSRSHCFQKSLR